MRNWIKSIILLTIFIMLSASCSSFSKIQKDPFYMSFFEKTRLIMTKEEIEIYKLLLDEELKKEFIEEFWRIRDPDPGTVENEAKIEFEERIKFANRWFWPFSMTRRLDEEPDNDSGWNTDRGRMYIILGPPDYIYIGGFPYQHDDIRTRRNEWANEEIWWYERHQLALYFQRSTGGDFRLTLDAAGAGLRVAMESAKLNLVTQGFVEDARRRFKFEAEFEDNTILIVIPVKRINFEGEGENLNARFRVKINVYHENKKVDEIEETRIFSESEEEVIMRKHIIFKYPFEPKLKGLYSFDIIVEDMLAMSFSKYRNYVKHKH
jgi:GWxTD domain-containing protein